MKLRILGGMTGTSCDGLDAVCMEFSRSGWKTLWSANAPYPTSLKKRVLAMQTSDFRITTRSLLELERDLGDWYGETFKKFISKNKKAVPHLIANHGQTVAHYPKSQFRGTTWQMNEAFRIAVQTGLTIIYDFRKGDVAAGGQGAPLAPLFHEALLKRAVGKANGVAVHNLGGISNVTYAHSRKIISWDTGPANLWIDDAVRFVTHGREQYDADGKLAASGTPDVSVIKKLLHHPYFRQPLPKSCGRDDFPFEMFLKATRAKSNDLIATATLFTAESIYQNYKKYILDRKLPLNKIYFCGGGVHNKTLIKMLSRLLRGTVISPIEELGVRSDTMEASAFAYLGYRSLLGEPLGGTWTSTEKFAPPGSILPGENWKDVLRILRNFL